MDLFGGSTMRTSEAPQANIQWCERGLYGDLQVGCRRHDRRNERGWEWDVMIGNTCAGDSHCAASWVRAAEESCGHQAYYGGDEEGLAPRGVLEIDFTREHCSVDG
jgi:hypothetical protein